MDRRGHHGLPAQPDLQGVPGEPLPPREVLEDAFRDFTDVPGFRRYAAFVDGRMAGFATMRLDNGLAQLCGAATLPEFRRRGIQTAFLRGASPTRWPKGAISRSSTIPARIEVATELPAAGLRAALQPGRAQSEAIRS